MSDYRRNFANIINGTLRLVGDYRGDGRNGRHFDRAEVGVAVNNAALDFVRSTGALKARRTIPVTSGTSVYSLPADCLQLLRVSLEGLSGTVLVPVNISDLDLLGLARSATGTPYEFYRQYLAYNQIGLIQEPAADGSSFERDVAEGLLRAVRDSGATSHYLPLDADEAIRTVEGAPYFQTGDGNVVQEVATPAGNLTVWYVRTPALMANPWDFPDPELPEFVHKDLKYKAAWDLLTLAIKGKPQPNKLKKFSGKWVKIIGRAASYVEPRAQNYQFEGA